MTAAAPALRRLFLTVNGQPRALEVPPRRTLAEALREDLRLTGTKVGCNRAECGSCTVVLDGRAVFACSVLAVEAAGRAVETVEGLAAGGGLHPLQAAFIEHDAVQCGICIPGMLMSLKALLDATLTPTEADVREAIAGNLCRCGTYPNTVKATLEAAKRLQQTDVRSDGESATPMSADGAKRPNLPTGEDRGHGLSKLADGAKRPHLPTGEDRGH